LIFAVSGTGGMSSCAEPDCAEPAVLRPRRKISTGKIVLNKRRETLMRLAQCDDGSFVGCESITDSMFGRDSSSSQLDASVSQTASFG
jgi:hypothetical protein